MEYIEDNAGERYYPEIRTSWWYSQPWAYDRQYHQHNHSIKKIVYVTIKYDNHLKPVNRNSVVCYLPFIYKDIIIDLS